MDPTILRDFLPTDRSEILRVTRFQQIEAVGMTGSQLPWSLVLLPVAVCKIGDAVLCKLASPAVDAFLCFHTISFSSDRFHLRTDAQPPNTLYLDDQRSCSSTKPGIMISTRKSFDGAASGSLNLVATEKGSRLTTRKRTWCLAWSLPEKGYIGVAYSSLLIHETTSD